MSNQDHDSQPNQLSGAQIANITESVETRIMPSQPSHSMGVKTDAHF